MTRKTSWHLMLAVGVAIYAAATSTAAGQEEKDDRGLIPALPPLRPTEKAKTPRDQRVFHLKHADARSTADVIRSVMGACRVGFDERTNSVVVVATPDDMATLEKLLAEIDSPAAGQTDTQTAMIRLRREAPEDLLALIHTLVSRRTRVAFDEGSGMLVIRGAGADVQEVERLIETLEQGEQEVPGSAGEHALQVSFYFVQGLYGEEEGSRGPAAEQEIPGRKRSAVDEATWSMLEEDVAVEFREHPFEAVLGQLAARGGIDILVVWNDLEAAGVDRDTPVTLVLKSETPLRNALQIILEQAGEGEVELGFSVNEGVVTVATRELLDQDLYTEVYSVHSLLRAAPRRYLQRAQVRQGDEGGPLTVAEPSPEEQRADDLLDLIRATVAPDSWRTEGGAAASADIAGGLLVVRQSGAAHQAIAELLHKLGAQQARARSAASFRPLPPALVPAGAALAENGFYQASLLAPLTVRVQGEDHFAVTGKTEQMGGAILIQVAGRARRRLPSDVVELEVEAVLSRQLKVPGDAAEAGAMFEIDSRVSARLGDFVVLAASPGATDYGQAVALVVQVSAVE